MGGHGHAMGAPCLGLEGTVEHIEGSGKRMHRLHDMQATFSPCQHGGMPKPVHSDGSPCAQCYGLVALDDQTMKHC